MAAKRRRRGVVRASTTRLKGKIRELAAQVDHPDTPVQARRFLQKIDALSSEFKDMHYEIIELLEAEDDLTKELDEFDDEISTMSVSVERLLASCIPNVNPEGRKMATKRMERLKHKLDVAAKEISKEGVDVYLLKQHESDMSGYKGELYDLHQELLALDLPEEDELNVCHTKLERVLFTTSMNLRKVLDSFSLDKEVTPTESKGVKLPKLDVPKFDGNILNWTTFWEQFNVSVHSQKSLSDAEKLVYLRSSVSDGSAKHAIEGLSRTGECYEEAIECLQSRYDRPRIIHQAHVKAIVEAQSLKDGTGRELRRLHDAVQQHLRALKAMDQEPSGPFITSVLELKMDPNTMFEWQRYSQDNVTDIPHYTKLLEFLNLRAQASESSMSEHRSKSKTELKRGSSNHKPITSCVTNTAESPRSNQCICCKANGHALYACPKFRNLSRPDKMSVLRINNLCINCLRPGHFVKECKSIHKCKVCHNPHHTLVHSEPKSYTLNDGEVPDKTPPINPVTSHAASRNGKGVLLMTCRVLVESPGGLSVEARGLLDSASSASFISERLTKVLQLHRTPSDVQISGITGMAPTVSTSMTTFTVSPLNMPTDRLQVSAIIVPRITCDLPVSPIPLNPTWSHIADIPLADSKFGLPGKIDILLGVDVFATVLKQGRRNGPPNSPTAIETDFGWVLAGDTSIDTSHTNVTSHHVMAAPISGDDILKRF